MIRRIVPALISVAVIVGCGGGGSDGTTATAPQSVLADVTTTTEPPPTTVAVPILSREAKLAIAACLDAIGDSNYFIAIALADATLDDYGSIEDAQAACKEARRQAEVDGAADVVVAVDRVLAQLGDLAVALMTEADDNTLVVIDAELAQAITTVRLAVAKVD